MKGNNNVSNLNLGHNVKPELERLAVEYGLDLVVLLGSYGTEHYIPGRSDVDIAYLSRKQLHADDYLQLMAALGAVFQNDRLDLIDLKRASGLFKYEVADKGRLLFHTREGYFEKYRLYCLRYYYDTAKFRALKKESFQEQLGALRDGQPTQ